MTPLLALKAGALVGAPLLVLATVLGPQVMMVDVREGGDGGKRIIVPVPLVLLRAGAALAPEEVTTIEVRELERMQPAARRFLEELKRTPDAELVRVVDGAETVSIRKVRDELRVEVRGPEEEIRVKVTIDGLRRVVDSTRGGTVRVGDLLAALGETSRGDLVTVRSGGDLVSVKLW